MYVFCCLWFFCFKHRTAFEMRISDWSSDFCSSDLEAEFGQPEIEHRARRLADIFAQLRADEDDDGRRGGPSRRAFAGAQSLLRMSGGGRFPLVLRRNGD